MVENLLNEEWREIENSKDYAISNLGRIKRTKRMVIHNINKSYYEKEENLLKPSNNNSKKYWRITINYKDGTKIVESIHRLVAKAFIPKIEGKDFVNHIDGDKNNNRVENLEWCTNLENMNHRFNILKKFTHNSGSKCNFSKLKEEDMYEIYNLIKQGIPKTKIAEIYKVSPTTITEFSSGRSWNHLKLFPYCQRKGKKYNTEFLN